ncbi:853_t:CDS:10 [Funneliformis geosporum]|nr:853_t:CDS:10 [Funneliformis geosporum]
MSEDINIETELGDDEFYVEKILDHTWTREGEPLFLLKWKGFPEEENSWIEHDNIIGGKPDPNNKNAIKGPKSLPLYDNKELTNEKLYTKPMINNKEEFPFVIPMITDPTIYQPNWEEFVDNILAIECSSNFIYVRIKWTYNQASIDRGELQMSYQESLPGHFNNYRLAATLGSRSNFRKLSKKEVNSVDIVNACKYITTPPEPLALRLTSNLMVGISRVFNQQYHFYYTDVNGVWHNLQKALTEIRGESIDMTNPQARREAITLKDDPFFEFELNFPMHGITMIHDLANQIELVQISSSSNEAVSVNGSYNKSNKSQLSSITLPEIDAGFTASSGFGVDLNDDILMKDDSGIRIEFDAEGGLHEVFTLQQLDDTSAMNDIIRIVNNDNNKAGLEGRREKQRRKRCLINEGNPQEIEVNNVLDFNDFEARDMEFSEGNQQQIPVEEQDNVNKENEPDEHPSPEQRRKRRRRVRVMFDEETELTNEQILEMRQGVIDDLDEAEFVKREKMRMQESKRQLENILYTPGRPFLAPQLASLWEQHYAPILYDENVKKRRRAQPSTSDLNLGERVERNDIYVGGSSIPRGIRDSLRSDEPERLRKEGSQQSSTIMTGMENFVGPEMDNFFDQYSSAGGSTDANMDLLGQLENDGGRRLDSMGFNLPAIDFLDDKMLEDDSFALPNYPIFGDFSLFDNPSRVGQSTSIHINSEQEAMNFLESIKSIMNEACVSIATFQDIMETQHVRRPDVARNFYYILGM